MSAAPAVGNDVVDLRDPRCEGKAADERFAARVLADSERADVAASSDPDLALWRRWAAKEAAFKAATVVRGGQPPPFVHASFVVEEEDASGGTVVWEELRLPWRVSGGREAGGIHVVAWSARDPGRPLVHGGTKILAADSSIPRERFTDRECRALHSPASAWVRIHARAHLATLLDRPERDVEIVCAEGPPGRVPPKALVGGRPTGWTVSLSHHGRLLGWVLARLPGEGEETGRVVAPAVPRRDQMPGGR